MAPEVRALCQRRHLVNVHLERPGDHLQRVVHVLQRVPVRLEGAGLEAAVHGPQAQPRSCAVLVFLLLRRTAADTPAVEVNERHAELSHVVILVVPVGVEDLHADLLEVVVARKVPVEGRVPVWVRRAALDVGFVYEWRLVGPVRQDGDERVGIRAALLIAPGQSRGLLDLHVEPLGVKIRLVVGHRRDEHGNEAECHAEIKEEREREVQVVVHVLFGSPDRCAKPVVGEVEHGVTLVDEVGDDLCRLHYVGREVVDVIHRIVVRTLHPCTVAVHRSCDARGGLVKVERVVDDREDRS
mmetsp:Transcript_26585/g.83164  ORF Transcript_26585/g.83164 Transcript_26585/m.83164 type:complete len:298 (+) Transcript_26585:3539-4432(+)